LRVNGDELKCSWLVGGRFAVIVALVGGFVEVFVAGFEAGR